MRAQGELRGVEAVVEEWKAANAPPDAMENIKYVLHCEAGSSTKAFQHGWVRDCDPETAALHADRTAADGTRGMTLDDFAAIGYQRAQLSKAHTFVLR